MTWLLAVSVIALPLLPASARADQREVELGFECFGYQTSSTRLNRDNVLRLDSTEGLLGAALGVKETHGALKLVARGYVERSVFSTHDPRVIEQAHRVVRLADGRLVP